MYKILLYIGSREFNPLWLTMVVVSLLLLALAQSYASAKKMKLGMALTVSLAILIIGNAITWLLFTTLFSEYNKPDYVFQHISIYSYGFMLMISFVVGTIYMIVMGKNEKPKIEADTVLDLMVFIIIGSIIGARLVYVATQWKDYASEAQNILRITEGGLSIHGGILGALVFGWFYCRIKGLDYWRMVDFTIPAVPLGMFFGRIGCFLNGCCYGISCGNDWPLGVTYPNAEKWMERGLPPDLANLYDAGLAAVNQLARHPAPLYEAFGAILIFWYLINFKKNSVFRGHVFLMFMWLYSLLRFVVENFRFGNPDNPIPEKVGSSIVLWNFITVAQLASIILAVVAFLLMQDLKRRAMLTKMLSESKDRPKAAEPRKAAEGETEVEEIEEEEIEVSGAPGLFGEEKSEHEGDVETETPHDDEENPHGLGS